LRLDDYEQARFHYQWALELATQMGDRAREADVAFNLGECEMLLQRPETAGPLLERAFEIFESLGDPSSQADVMIVQAQVQLELGRTQSARATLDAAASMCESIGDPLRLSHVHMVYGHVHFASKDHHTAMHAYHQAGTFARLADNAIMQARAEQRIGDIYELYNKIETARRHWRKGLLLYGENFPSPATDMLREKLMPRAPRRAAS
jgi:tetratricopeptide (TPR) repeat protein